jgi:predicted MFS family arabinose efflux permease
MSAGGTAGDPVRFHRGEFGPFLTAYFARFERRLFISILIMFGLANTVAALAPNIWVMALHA